MKRPDNHQQSRAPDLEAIRAEIREVKDFYFEMKDEIRRDLIAELKTNGWIDDAGAAANSIKNDILTEIVAELTAKGWMEEANGGDKQHVSFFSPSTHVH